MGFLHSTLLKGGPCLVLAETRFGRLIETLLCVFLILSGGRLFRVFFFVIFPVVMGRGLDLQFCGQAARLGGQDLGLKVQVEFEIHLSFQCLILEFFVSTRP